jgi:hypothetical protein
MPPPRIGLCGHEVGALANGDGSSSSRSAPDFATSAETIGSLSAPMGMRLSLGSDFAPRERLGDAIELGSVADG